MSSLRFLWRGLVVVVHEAVYGLRSEGEREADLLAAAATLPRACSDYLSTSGAG